MSTMTQSQIHVGCLVSRIALGSEGKAFQKRIEFYLEKSGVEWTNNRMKVIWNAAILLRSGKVDGVKELYQQNSIAYHKSTLIPKGIEGRVLQRFIEAQRPSVIKRLAAVMRFYCSLKLTDLSQKQCNKALNSITSGYAGQEIALHGLGVRDLSVSLKERNKRFKSLDEFPLREDEIHAEHLKSTSKYYSQQKVPGDLRGIPYSSMALSFATEPHVPSSIDHMVPCYEIRQGIKSDPWYIDHPQKYLGKITVIQEQGCKARVVCQPSSWLQLAFMPLHNRISKIADSLFPAESCVRDQTSGVYTMLDHMSRGHSVYCTDLSSATDRFPVEYSLGVLDELGYGSYASALREVCNSDFSCSFSSTGSVKYAVGQPMGLYGSFPLFHLSNMLVADAAVRASKCNYYGRPLRYQPVPFRDGSFFRTVGDDIIFSDEHVSLEYRKIMERFGVGISESKSFSGKAAEFAGFIGLKTNKSAVAFRPYKVPSGQVINNTLQFLDALGSKVNKISKWWEKQFISYQYTIGSRDLALEPLVPGDSPSHIQTSNRGDNLNLVNLWNAIASISEEQLPDLSKLVKISSNPLFRERGMFDFYGYNPNELLKDEKLNVPTQRLVARSISNDPLIAEVRDVQLGRSKELIRVLVNPESVKPSNPPDMVGSLDEKKLAVDESCQAKHDKSLTHQDCSTDLSYYLKMGLSLDDAIKWSSPDYFIRPSNEKDGFEP